jgi:hypothetical protein
MNGGCRLPWSSSLFSSYAARFRRFPVLQLVFQMWLKVNTVQIHGPRSPGAEMQTGEEEKKHRRSAL